MDDRFLIIFVTRQQDITVYQHMDANNQLKTSPLRELNQLYKNILLEHQTNHLYTLTNEARERIVDSLRCLIDPRRVLTLGISTFWSHCPDKTIIFVKLS